MRYLEGKTALVTGGSRGLGLAIVRALAAEEANVWALARNAERLEQLTHEVVGIHMLAADVADVQTAPQALHAIRPDILVLNAGVTPTMAPVHQQTWEQFSQTWNTDVHMAFSFGKAALLQPLAPGSTVIIVSSGAAVGGSPLSGGYAGAKRMQWFLAHYLQSESNALHRDVRFVALLPRQIIPTTHLGHVASTAYAAQQGISQQAFVERAGLLLTPQAVGDAVVALLTEPVYRTGTAFVVTSRGLELLDT